jgi:ATP-binding cassette subfamily B protein
VAVVAYIAFTKAVTDWRVRLREEWTSHDTATTARAVDSLLNFETVKYFNAEERERRCTARRSRTSRVDRQDRDQPGGR